MARQDSRFAIVEETAIEAWGLLMRLPDRERGFLTSGSRSALPAPIRDRITDYADVDAVPRRQLGRREMALVGEWFLDPECLVMEIAPSNRALVALVLTMRGRRGGGGFEWSEVWTVLGGRRLGVTSDALRMRYERSMGRIAAVIGEREEVL